MLSATTSAREKREAFRKGLESGELIRFPGAMSPLVAMLIEEIGFEGVYISGAVMSAELGLPDIGLTTLSEVAQRGHQIARMTNLPALIDADTGFGEAMNAARTVTELESAGLSGCHLEDQVNPKRCGHLDNKTITDTAEMVQRLRAAADARCDANFVIMARTDSRSVEGLAAAIERAKAYVDAGADVIFPEALENEGEFGKFRAAIDAPLLANMTEFGKTKLLTADTLRALGINMVIYPVTSLRLAMGAIEAGLTEIRDAGTQAGLIEKMQTRKRLYEVIDYEGYNQFDTNIFNFKL